MEKLYIPLGGGEGLRTWVRNSKKGGKRDRRESLTYFQGAFPRSCLGPQCSESTQPGFRGPGCGERGTGCASPQQMALCAVLPASDPQQLFPPPHSSRQFQHGAGLGKTSPWPLRRGMILHMRPQATCPFVVSNPNMVFVLRLART